MSGDLENPESTALWERVVPEILSGGTTGQEILYAVFERGVRFYLAHHMRTEDVEDKVHDTFLAVVNAIRDGQLREPGRMAGFVRTILERQLAGYFTEAQRRQGLSSEDVSQIQPRERLNPEQEAMRAERRRFARKILRGLPEVDREILMRFYLEGQTAEQICFQLGVSETQFRLRKNRAKQRFGELVREAVRKKPGRQLLLRKSAASGH
ncbi:MAG: sigma-70 family RNA polymerase sigma factor [Acidobacteria bacterium]|nr:sigma-70 family RNA polymerase sigma factor [Acidobacteriota bacterium]